MALAGGAEAQPVGPRAVGDPLEELAGLVEREGAWIAAQTRTTSLEAGVSMPWDDALVLPSEAHVRGGELPAAAEPGDPLEAPSSLSFRLDAIERLPLELVRVDHPALLHFLEFYATEGATRAARWLARAGRWRPMIERIADEVGAPRDLIWIAAIESSFTNDAISSASAVGMWQFMERTGREQGLRIDRWVDERRDPEAATRAALVYLLDRRDRFGSWPLAFAAYNAGSGHVRAELRSVSATDFWTLDRYAALYGDARRYALRALTLAVIANNRAAFGLDGLVEDPPLTWDTVDVPGGVRLSLLADAAGISLGELQDLNPALRRNQTPPDIDAWPLRIPAGTSGTFVHSYDQVERRYGRDHVRVALRVGESVDALAARYGTPARVVRAVNGLDRHDQPTYGSELIVPSRERSRDGLDLGPPPAPETRDVVIVPPTAFTYPDRHRVFYTVLPWDDPATIAHALGIDERELCVWNDLDPGAELWSGMVLQAWLPAPPDPSRIVYRDERHVQALRLDSAEYAEWVASQAQESSRSRTRRWRVRAGDTVNGLARRFGVRPRDIMRWNGLDDDARIRIGDELIVGR